MRRRWYRRLPLVTRPQKRCERLCVAPPVTVVVMVDIEPNGIQGTQELRTAPTPEARLRQVDVEPHGQRVQVPRQIFNRDRALAPTRIERRHRNGPGRPAPVQHRDVLRRQLKDRCGNVEDPRGLQRIGSAWRIHGPSPRLVTSPATVLPTPTGDRGPPSAGRCVCGALTVPRDADCAARDAAGATDHCPVLAQ